ncbi:MAG TPA: phosphatidate cytidylyltransferase [Verrucomicrobiae bacterium]|jgi:phosphatidate cytidylyltransferase|nr:phosphatidate cytidylyltransferase [Verrucomicrobiae bacterium]
MNYKLDHQMFWIANGIFVGLLAASLTGLALARIVKSEGGQATVANLNARIRAWWVMIGIFALSFMIGTGGSMLLFAFISLLALREYVSLIGTVRADHRTLFWAFFVFTPAQYFFWYEGWYGVAIILIPVYAFLFIPTRLVLAHDTTGFLDRAARLHWGLMVCVYCISYAPALLTLNIPNYQKQNAKLLLFLVMIAQLSDVFQYIWGKLLGKHKIAPAISPNKTWEGFVGGVASACALGTGLWWMTPFSPLQALGMSFAITLMGFAGGLTMSAIKRDRGVKDFGATIEGHGGILDRMDSICFSAPLFFHLTRWIFVSPHPTWFH